MPTPVKKVPSGSSSSLSSSPSSSSGTVLSCHTSIAASALSNTSVTASSGTAAVTAASVAALVASCRPKGSWTATKWPPLPVSTRPTLGLGPSCPTGSYTHRGLLACCCSSNSGSGTAPLLALAIAFARFSPARLMACTCLTARGLPARMTDFKHGSSCSGLIASSLLTLFLVKSRVCRDLKAVLTSRFARARASCKLPSLPSTPIMPSMWFRARPRSLRDGSAAKAGRHELMSALSASFRSSRAVKGPSVCGRVSHLFPLRFSSHSAGRCDRGEDGLSVALASKLL
mmetsp:Transcript_20018/g.55729  ORF Transcript_20018/g.55729 Transcript_20018/m.55729 type:complete len:287 (+) Transcript_20018:1659-2519(+)